MICWYGYHLRKEEIAMKDKAVIAVLAAVLIVAAAVGGILLRTRWSLRIRPESRQQAWTLSTRRHCSGSQMRFWMFSYCAVLDKKKQGKKKKEELDNLWNSVNEIHAKSYASLQWWCTGGGWRGDDSPYLLQPDGGRTVSVESVKPLRSWKSRTKKEESFRRTLRKQYFVFIKEPSTKIKQKDV